MTTAQPPTGDAGEYRYRDVAVPGPCPEHPACLLLRCARYRCTRPVHVNLLGRGRPKRYCSGACRVAQHRFLN
ncbi:MAG: hypothetical protein NVSMB32_12980 [Actinomycetota bacterium]